MYQNGAIQHVIKIELFLVSTGFSYFLAWMPIQAFNRMN